MRLMPRVAVPWRSKAPTMAALSLLLIYCHGVAAAAPVTFRVPPIKELVHTLVELSDSEHMVSVERESRSPPSRFSSTFGAASLSSIALSSNYHEFPAYINGSRHPVFYQRTSLLFRTDLLFACNISQGPTTYPALFGMIDQIESSGCASEFLAPASHAILSYPADERTWTHDMFTCAVRGNCTHEELLHSTSGTSPLVLHNRMEDVAESFCEGRLVFAVTSLDWSGVDCRGVDFGATLLPGRVTHPISYFPVQSVKLKERDLADAMTFIDSVLRPLQTSHLENISELHCNETRIQQEVMECFDQHWAGDSDSTASEAALAIASSRVAALCQPPCNSTLDVETYTTYYDRSIRDLTDDLVNLYLNPAYDLTDAQYIENLEKIQGQLADSIKKSPSSDNSTDPLMVSLVVGAGVCAAGFGMLLFVSHRNHKKVKQELILSKEKYSVGKKDPSHGPVADMMDMLDQLENSTEFSDIDRQKIKQFQRKIRDGQNMFAPDLVEQLKDNDCDPEVTKWLMATLKGKDVPESPVSRTVTLLGAANRKISLSARFSHNDLPTVHSSGTLASITSRGSSPIRTEPPMALEVESTNPPLQASTKPSTGPMISPVILPQALESTSSSRSIEAPGVPAISTPTPSLPAVASNVHGHRRKSSTKGTARRCSTRLIQHAVPLDTFVCPFPSPPLTTVPCVDEVGKHILEWGALDVLELSEEMNPNHVLTVVVSVALSQFGIVDALKIDTRNLQQYLDAVAHFYLPTNAYHNSLHAADVTHSISTQLALPALAEMVTQEEKLAAVLAAAIHDVGHTGQTNPFHITSSSDLAVWYSDRSCLESYHLALGFGLMRVQDRNVLSTLSGSTANFVRTLMIEMVLATDLAKSYDVLSRFALQVSNEPSSVVTTKGGWRDNPSSRSLMLQMCLKVSDIGHASKPLELHIEWSRRVSEEFFEQGDLERALNLPLSALCDRNTANLPKSQAGFLTIVVIPVLETWFSFTKDSTLLNQVRKNLDYWKTEQGHSVRPSTAGTGTGAGAGAGAGLREGKVGSPLFVPTKRVSSKSLIATPQGRRTSARVAPA